MAINVTATKTLVITGSHDPITVFAEDHGPSRGAITIRCYDKAWCAGWGGMGARNILEFFASCDSHYLIKNLVSADRRTETDVAGTIKTLKRRIIEARRTGSHSKEETRELWDNHITELDDDMPEWQLFSAMSGMEYDLIEDATNKKLSPDAEWLRDEIIPAVREAIAELKKEAAEPEPLTPDTAPVGTIAPAIMGGHWYKTERGWKWNGPEGSSGTFPRPGGDWSGKLIVPADYYRNRRTP